MLRLLAPLFVLAPVLVSALAQAQSYPSRPIQFIVPYAAGGNGDIVSRLVGQRLAPVLGQPVLIDNRPGAGGNIGAQAAARATPDGHTWVLTSGTHAINMTLYKSPGYDVVRDFAPVAMLTSAPFVLIVHPSVKAATLKELIALVKASPGKLNYGSAGSGAGAHVTTELLKSMAGIDMTHVPYKGTPQATTDLVAGQVQVMFNAPSTALPLMQSGKVRALGISSRRPSPLAPGLPTISDSGLPGFDSTVWQGILVPARTPVAVVARLNREVNLLLNSVELKDQLFKQGVDPEPMTPEEFGAYIRSEVEKWAHIVKVSGATVD
jgi:tripartite-type tricarboxylate transporter receptor subunit TctC